MKNLSLLFIAFLLLQNILLSFLINYHNSINKNGGIMSKFFPVLFLVLFSFTTFAQNKLSDSGTAEVKGTSTYEPSDAPVVFLDQAPKPG